MTLAHCCGLTTASVLHGFAFPVRSGRPLALWGMDSGGSAGPGNMNENSVYLGLGVVCLFCYVWKNRSLVYLEELRFWYLLAADFHRFLGRLCQLGFKVHLLFASS